MSQLTTRFLIVFLTFVIGIFSAAGWFYYQESQKVEIQLPDHRWETIFFNGVPQTNQDGITEVRGGISHATKLAGLDEIRKTSLSKDDLEVRVWRGFGLSPLEAVSLKRVDGIWSGFHIKLNEYNESEKAKMQRLYRPKSGWESFWRQITEKGILTLRDPSEINCEDSRIDGTSYVVEINQNKIYRTYRMSEGGKCDGVQQMEDIDDLIGEEFDSGQEQCNTNEWFACAKLRKSRRLNDRY